MHVLPKYGLKIDVLKKSGATNISTDPSEFIKSNVMLNEADFTEDTYSFFQWRRIVDDDGKTRLKIISIQENKKEFMISFQKETTTYKDHLSTLINQFQTLKQNKESLQVGQIIVHMDFAENYTCKSLDEIQSAYWATRMVTIHPIVIHYRDESGDLVTNRSLLYQITIHIMQLRYCPL